MAKWNEDTRVKIPGTIQLMRLGYEYQSLENADIDFRTKIFKERFKHSLEKINHKKLDANTIEALLNDIFSMIKNNDLGKEFYRWLIDPKDKIKLIDFDNINNNDFAVVDELPFSIKEETQEGSFRPDINILINGMPLAFLEVKKPNNDGGIQKEFNRMINERLQKEEFEKYFNLIQIVSFSNNMDYEDPDDAEDVRAGSFYTTPNGFNTSFSFLREDKTDGDDVGSEITNYHRNYKYHKISDKQIREVIKDCGYDEDLFDNEEFKTNLDEFTPCNRFITSLYDKERVLYFIHYGMMYVNGKNGKREKHIMRYPQFFATRKIIERLENGGKNGIIWHTQGSGKTALAAFSNRVLKDYYSKKGINTRFYFVVDRLDLLTQASSEFMTRGFTVNTFSTKDKFAESLGQALSKSLQNDSFGEFTVVNIHKFQENMPKANNDYDVKVQRVFFIDEIQRSYAKEYGEFYSNLMLCDEDGIFIGLTGTPLLTKKERSNLKFGDYIHKYFYDKSIADGYTLRIKKEHIDTYAKTEIKKKIELEDDKDFNKKEVYESPGYVKALGEFIENDFKNFRLINKDDTIGGMIVCRSDNQAKKVHEWFETNSTLKTGLVISDEDPKQQAINKTNQLDFQDTNVPDMLVVNLMLTTGYDVHRLKKMYLLREPHSHSLLQTISRVNRPYKSQNGNVYKYGYIVDFVDIEDELNTTMSNYIKELEADLNTNGEDEGSLSGLIIDKEDIQKRYLNNKKELDGIIDTDNVEVFQQRLNNYNKDAILKIKRLLINIKDARVEFLLSKADDYAKQIDKDKITKLIRATEDKIKFLNLQNNSIHAMDVLSNEELVEVVYQFLKTSIDIIDLGKLDPDDTRVSRLRETIKRVKGEIDKNKNKKDRRIVELEELLNELFERMDIKSLDELDEINNDFDEALETIIQINNDNDRLAERYDGNFAFVKTYQDIADNNRDINVSDIEDTILIAYEDLKDKIDDDSIIVQGRKNFVSSVKSDITKILLKEGLYKKIKNVYERLLNDLYTNIQLHR